MISKSNTSDIQTYLIDAANIRGNCNILYFPEDTDDVGKLLREANKYELPITISGGRTGLTGGCVPQKGNLVSLEKFNNIISIDVNEKTATVQPGVLLEDLQNEIEKYKLFYPPDPTETKATIGGTVATNASGARTLKYGSTRNFVNEIEIVLPSGNLLNIKRNENFASDYSHILRDGDKDLMLKIPDYQMPETKHAAGYYCKKNMDIIDLFIGSEGTLGVITKIKLRLLAMPENVLSIIIFFDNEDDIFSFVNDIKAESKNENLIVDVREIEFFDENALILLKDEFPNIPDNSMGAIWIEQEYKSDKEDEVIDEITKIIRRNNVNEDSIWFAVNENDRKKLKHFRHSIPLKTNEIISRRNLIKVGTDTAVPDEKLYEFYEWTKNQFLKNKIDFAIYGHIGNSHLHFNMLPKNHSEFLTCKNLYAEICRKSVELGGTISAEHGIGKLKTQYLLEMFGEKNILQMAKLKKTFDPNFILNVGNIFDEKYLHKV